MNVVIRMSITAAALLTADLAIAGDPPPMDGNASAKVVTTCQTCHGLRGDSPSGTVPRLNGQHVEYLMQRLKDFHDPGSQDPHATEAMWGIVENIDDRTLAEIAKYYAAQAPTKTSNRGALAENGGKLYASGDPANGVPACAMCHDADADDRRAIPRLGGQHAVYLQNQLERLRLGLRDSDIMHPRINGLSDRQIKALVAYLASD